MCTVKVTRQRSPLCPGACHQSLRQQPLRSALQSVCELQRPTDTCRRSPGESSFKQPRAIKARCSRLGQGIGSADRQLGARPRWLPIAASSLLAWFATSCSRHQQASASRSPRLPLGRTGGLKFFSPYPLDSAHFRAVFAASELARL